MLLLACAYLALSRESAIAPGRIDRFVEDLRLFGIGWSWAGPMSLAVPYRADSGRVGPYTSTLVRLSIGLEDPDDLIRDLDQALDKLAAS